MIHLHFSDPFAANTVLEVLVYMIIGLTSLCLYNSTDFWKMQYVKLYKVNKTNLYNSQKLV